mgnify:CR=1 FL=1
MSRKTREEAKVRVAAETKKRSRRRLVRSVFAAAAFAGIGYAAASYVTSAVEPAATATWDTAKVYPSDISFGNPKAAVRVTEYASLTCIHCSNFHEKALPDFLRQQVDTGKVHLVFRHFPYDAAGMAAAQAVTCLPPSRRADAVKTLMRDQDAWMKYDKAGLAALDLLGLSEEDRRKAGECVEKETHAKEIGETVVEARQNGISSTPTFVIGDKVYPGFLGADALGRIIDASVPAGKGQDPR